MTYRDARSALRFERDVLEAELHERDERVRRLEQELRVAEAGRAVGSTKRPLGMSLIDQSPPPRTIQAPTAGPIWIVVLLLVGIGVLFFVLYPGFALTSIFVAMLVSLLAWHDTRARKSALLSFDPSGIGYRKLAEQRHFRWRHVEDVLIVEQLWGPRLRVRTDVEWHDLPVGWDIGVEELSELAREWLAYARRQNEEESVPTPHNPR